MPFIDSHFRLFVNSYYSVIGKSPCFQSSTYHCSFHDGYDYRSLFKNLLLVNFY